jgi:BlaI family penicillinase repressor
MKARDQEIRDTEWDLMEVLWTAERITAREVAEALAEKRGWAYSTVKTLLDRMVDKGLCNARQVGNVWEYTPAIGRPEARQRAWRRFVQTAFGGVTGATLQFVAKEAKLSKKERESLRALLEKMED